MRVVSGMRRLGMPLRQRTLLTSVAAAASAATCAAACAAATTSAAAPKCKSSRARESDKLRPRRPDKRQRHRFKSKSARDAETQTEPCAALRNLRVVAQQELWVVQGLARFLANTVLDEEVRTCGERLALALALHDGDGGGTAAAAQLADPARAAGPGGAR